MAGIVRGQRAITAGTALLLGGVFGTSPEMWPRLRAAYDLRVAERTTGLEVRARLRAYNLA